MMQVYSCLVHEHDFRLIILAALVCTMAAFTVFTILERARLARGPFSPWPALAGIVSGIGIWATHFIAMLAYDPGIPVQYDPILTLASVLAAIGVTGVGWWIAIGTRRHAAAAGGTVVALGIAAMHYIGMAAVELPGLFRWDRPLIAASIAASIALTVLAVREHRRRSALIPWRSALAFVLAICSLHFVAMGAVTVYPSGAVETSEALIDRSALAALVLAGSVLVVAMGFFVVLYDRVTEREKAAARIAHLAYHDTLTGLSNRSVLENHLSRSIDHAGRNEAPLAMICVDLDGFKAVNDTYGHAAGDALLVKVANRLRSLVRGNELVARTGGDEFIIVQEGGLQPTYAAQLAERIIASLERPFEILGRRVAIGASVGVSLFPKDATSADDLSKKADAALYRAKSAGRGQACFYETWMEDSLRQRRRLEADLPLAISEAQFEVHYQPIADLASGTVIGFEALLRWDHPELGPIEPEKFIRVAEERALIARLGKWVLGQACREAASWSEPLIVSVNFSPAQFLEPGLARAVASVLAETGLDPGRLDLEITENVLISDPENALRIFNELKRMGVHISLDDFGVGYSSLGYFRSFPFDKVKIDRSFIADIAGQSPAREIVCSVIALARRLGITAVAEGVETSEQLEILREMGCPQVQGYLIGRPGPIEHFEGVVVRRGGGLSKVA